MDGTALVLLFPGTQVHIQSFSSSWTVPQQHTWDTSSHPWVHQEEEESSRRCDSCHHIHHTAAVCPRCFLYHKISKHRDQPVGEKKGKKLQEVSHPEPALLKLRNKGWYSEVQYMSINPGFSEVLIRIASVSFPKQHWGQEDFGCCKTISQFNWTVFCYLTQAASHSCYSKAKE